VTLTIVPIDRCAYQPLCLSTITPINHCAYQPSGLFLHLLSLLASLTFNFKNFSTEQKTCSGIENKILAHFWLQVVDRVENKLWDFLPYPRPGSLL